MTMHSYLYSGPVSGASINHAGAVLDVLLHPGKTVQLPPEHEYTQTLLGLGYLTRVDAPAPEPEPEPAPAPAPPRGKKAPPAGAA